MKIERVTKMKTVKENLLQNFRKDNQQQKTKERMVVTLDKILA